MKKPLLLISLIFCGAAAFAQITPNVYGNVQNINQCSPNMAKTAYLTNLNGKLIQAYPNPATDRVVIQHVATNDMAVIYLVSGDGRMLLQQKVIPNTLQTELSVGVLSKGIYIVKFDNSKGDVRTLQLVKN